MNATIQIILLNAMIFGGTAAYAGAQSESVESRERIARASSHLADGFTVHFSIGDRRVAVAALEELDGAGIPYRADVFGGETIVYTTKEAYPSVNEIMNRTITTLQPD